MVFKVVSIVIGWCSKYFGSGIDFVDNYDYLVH